VGVLLILFLLFGGSFLPLTQVPTSPSAPLVTTTLIGADASRFLRGWKTTDPKAATALLRARLREGSPGGETQVVVLKGRRKPVPTGVIGWLSAVFSTSADEYYYTENGVMILTPIEDSDPDFAAFDIYYGEGESSYGGHVRINTYEAAYGDPDDAVEVTDSWTNCSVNTPSESFWATLLRPFADRVLAQTAHDGGACDDLGHLDSVSLGNLKDGLKYAVFAAGAAAIPCIGATIGWAICVGGAAIGGAAISLGWDLAEMLWDCRCTWFDVNCSGGGVPPI
jgi:hypothetical protein